MKRENRGGPRPGAGRPRKPPKEYSEMFKCKIMKALREQEKKAGESVYDIFARMFYDSKVSAATKVRLWQVLAEIMVVKESKQTIESGNYGPVIYLPEIQKKPAEYEELGRQTKRNLVH